MKSIRRMLRSPLNVTIIAVLLWVIAVFLLLPNISVLAAVFTDGTGAVSFRAFERLISSERSMQSLANSFVLAAVLAVTVNIVGIFIVLVTRFYAIRGAKILWVGYATTLVCGGIVLIFGYRQVYGPTGLVTKLLSNFLPNLDPNWFSGMFAVVMVMTFASTGNHLLFLSAAVSKIDFQTVEAARMLGASDRTLLWRVILPLLKPMTFAITVLTFLGGLSALAAPQVLGGRDFQTVAPMILNFSRTISSRDLAATLALVLGVATIILLAILNRVEKYGTYFSVAKVAAPLQKQPIRNRAASVTVHIIAYLLWAVYILPPVLITIFSFTNARAINSGDLTWDSFTLDNYITVLTTERGFQPFLVSLVYSAVASVIVVVLILFAARLLQKHRNWFTQILEYALYIPWLLPATTIALGLILTFDHPQPAVFGKVLTGTSLILGIAYVLGKIPFTLRLLKAAFAGVPDHQEEAAAILGAKPLRSFRVVVVPAVIPTAAAIMVLNFSSLLDEYDSAAFLAYPLLQPLGIVIKNATSGETVDDSTALVYVYAVLLMVISAIALWVVYGRASNPKTRFKRSFATSADR
ncbi:iron ABC transporter permease [Arthrobacter sp. StoSoilB5]|uniref:ABC transporter permease n=1 Tax=Arthrobacter sp. StoSoilB5 TaxID=2830992 RepID=UPI001CC7E0CF|nr:iron ABC transporter permease [Arthrobacter sp. StoSoilB5]BCW44743.1 iron ABC transporter permease [Arthrobacter sp. StoSoilB5]